VGIMPLTNNELPDIKPGDIKLDTSKVDVMDEKTLTETKQKWVCDSRSNEQLVFLLKMCPEKIDRIQANMANEKDPDQIKMMTEKIERLKEEYAVCIKEIEMRKG
jgi:hypothetical protein